VEAGSVGRARRSQGGAQTNDVLTPLLKSSADVHIPAKALVKAGLLVAQGLGVHRAPGIPHALSLQGRKF
jgi:hypothetical protein